MNIPNKFDITQEVYLKTDKDQEPRLVVAMNVTQKGLLYQLANGEKASWHYDFEITAEKNILATTSGK